MMKTWCCLFPAGVLADLMSHEKKVGWLPERTKTPNGATGITLWKVVLKRVQLNSVQSQLEVEKWRKPLRVFLLNVAKLCSEASHSTVDLRVNSCDPQVTDTSSFHCVHHVL